MTAVVLDEGRPVVVTAAGDRIGRGPWARWLATAIVPDEGSARAERGRELARTGRVHTVTVAAGHVSARVAGASGGEYDVGLSAEPVPPRTWTALCRSPAARTRFGDALAGREQSVHLEHALAQDWEQPLVPRGQHIRRACTCPDAEYAGTCKHVVALAYVLADAIDADPSLLLRWRGCLPSPGDEPRASEPPRPPVSAPTHDPWQAGELPEQQPLRALPPGAVLKRLGASGITVDGGDLVDALERAYAAFAAGDRDS